MTRASAPVLMLAQLIRLENGCKPGKFFDLFALADEFCKVTSLYSSLESSALRVVLEKMEFVAATYHTCVAESQLKQLLNDVPRPQGASALEEIGELGRALHTANQRAYFLLLLVNSSLASAARMLLTANVTYDVDHLVAWDTLLEVVRNYPVLAGLATGCDFVKLRDITIEHRHLHIQAFRAHGYEPILPCHALVTAENDAWRAWFQASQMSGQERLSLLKTAAGTLGSALNFLLRTEGTVRADRRFDCIYDGASMTAIVRELNHEKLNVLPAHEIEDILNRPPIEGYPIFFYFKEGTIRTRRYVVDLPHLSCLCIAPTYSAHEEWKNDPIAFARKNVHNIPHSHHASTLQIEYDRIQASVFEASLAATEERIEKRVGPILKEISPEAIAIMVAEGTGLPPIVTPVLTLFFRRLLRLLQKDSSTEDT
jgi:hypothetical protein